VSTGQTVGGDWQMLSRTRLTLSDAFYLSGPRHDLKVGGEMSFGTNELDAHFFEDGFFIFRSDLPFDPNSPVTWPTSFQQQPRNVQTYRARQLALFIQDDWRAAKRLRLNLGVRYDLDPTLRINDFYEGLLRGPELARLNEFVSGDRGTDTNNFQPRLGATYDLRGDGRVVMRGGWGMYVARNRPWFQLRSMNQVGRPPCSLRIRRG
jgi:outer membrane receptor protein involved in Fe transport